MNTRSLLHSEVEDLPVEILMWPRDADRRDVFARASVPRLLLVEEGSSPPTITGVDEDWIRFPAAREDIAARAMQVLRSSASLRWSTPYIEAGRWLHRANATVALSPTEGSIMTILLQHQGEIVTRESLEHNVWQCAAPSADALDAAIYRLRRRLSGLSMNISSVRGRGFVLRT